MTDKARPNKAVSRDQRRQSLIEASRDLFAHKGYHATTVDDITKAAGVAKGTFYLYFSEKREVYREVIAGFMQLIKDIGSSVGAESQNPLDFFARAEAAAQKLMAIFMEHRELARLAYRESMGLDPSIDEMIRGFYREIAEVEARNIQVAMDMGIVRQVDPMITAYAHIGMVERVLLAMADAPDEFPEPRRIVRTMTRLAYEGIKAPGAPSPFSPGAGPSERPAAADEPGG